MPESLEKNVSWVFWIPLAIHLQEVLDYKKYCFGLEKLLHLRGLQNVLMIRLARRLQEVFKAS